MTGVAPEVTFARTACSGARGDLRRIMIAAMERRSRRMQWST